MTAIRGKELGKMARAWQAGEISPEAYFDWAYSKERESAIAEVSQRLADAETQRLAENRAALMGVVYRAAGYIIQKMA